MTTKGAGSVPAISVVTRVVKTGTFAGEFIFFKDEIAIFLLLRNKKATPW